MHPFYLRSWIGAAVLFFIFLSQVAFIDRVHAQASTPRSEYDLLLFGSLDAGAATFLSAGAKLAPGRLDRQGFALLASIGTGHRREAAPCGCAHPITLRLSRYTATAAALVGYQWFFDWGVVGAFAGPEGSVEALTDGSQVAGLPARYGLRVQGEIWARPTGETLVQATAILGSAREDAWGRIAWGYRLWDTYLGPEASLYLDRLGYRKWSLGVHATDFALGTYSLRVSAGIQGESDAGSVAPHLALAVWTPL